MCSVPFKLRGEVADIKEDLDSPPSSTFPEDNIPDLPSPVLNSGQPIPSLSLNHTERGLEVLWDYSKSVSPQDVKEYELYSYNSAQISPIWKKVGKIQSIKLPIKVTLSEFKTGSSYYFAVRARSLDNTLGPYSEVQKICL